MRMAWHAPVLGLVPASPGPVLASHRLKQWHQPERPVGRKRKDKKRGRFGTVLLALDGYKTEENKRAFSAKIKREKQRVRKEKE